MRTPSRPTIALALVLTWAAVLVVWTASRPWGAFSRDFAQDSATMMWLHEWASGAAFWTFPDVFGPFDHPCPRPTVTVPSRTDALLGAPWAWLLAFPAQWNAHVATAAGLAALGCAALTRALGAGALGTLVAGVLGSAMLPVWSQMWAGQANGAYVGAVPLALAFVFALLRDPGQRPARLALWFVGAAVSFAFAGAVYPPQVLLWVPTGLVLLLPELWRAGPRRSLLALLAVVASLVLASPDLARALAFNAASFYQPGPDADAAIACLPEDGRLLTSAVALTGWSGTGHFTYGQAALGAWLLAPLALLVPGTRLRAALVLLLTLALAGLSLSPCVSAVPQTDQLLLVRPGPLLPLWQAAASLHRYERLLMAALAHAAVLSGLGVHALLAPGRGKTLRTILAGLLAAAVSAQSVAILYSELRPPDRWVSTDVDAVLAVIDASGAQTVAILPPTERLAYRVAIERPDLQLVNPFRPDRYTKHDDAFLMQLNDLTAGIWPQPPLAPPGPGLDLVVHTTASEWCRRSELPGEEACLRQLPTLLIDWLGPPDGEQQGVSWWALAGGSSTATCGEHLRRNH